MNHPFLSRATVAGLVGPAWPEMQLITTDAGNNKPRTAALLPPHLEMTNRKNIC
jgi:hypothetical protein